MGEMPRNSQAMAMVLAVNWPPQAPAPGQAAASMASRPASSSFPAACEPMASKTSWMVMVFAVQMAGRDGAAVEHQRRNVETSQRHDCAGHVFVASGDGNQSVEEIAARDQLDGVGDDLAADQRGLHALGAHGDAVGDGDGVELHRRAAGFAHALLDSLSDVTQVEIAGADFGPGICDSDDRLVQVFFREADAAQHGARCGAARSFGKRRCVYFLGLCRRRSCHLCSCVCGLRGCWSRFGRGVTQKALSCCFSNVSSASAWRSVRPMSSSPSSRQ